MAGLSTTILSRCDALLVVDFRCDARVEGSHDELSISYVRRGSLLSFRFSPSLVDEQAWRADGVPPLAELTVLGGLAQAAADGTSISIWCAAGSGTPPACWPRIPRRSATSRCWSDSATCRTSCAQHHHSARTG